MTSQEHKTLYLILRQRREAGSRYSWKIVTGAKGRKRASVHRHARVLKDDPPGRDVGEHGIGTLTDGVLSIAQCAQSDEKGQVPTENT